MDTPWYASLNNTINSSYSIAQAYYAQRENQFRKVVFNDSKKALNDFAKQLTATAKAYRPNVYDQVEAALKNKPLPSTPPSLEYKVDVQTLYNAARNNKKGLQFIAGEHFEYFLQEHIRLNDRQGRKISSYIVQQVGKVINKAFTTSGGGKDTRTDVAIRRSTIDKNTQMELTIGLDLHNDELEALGTERKIVYALIRETARNGVDLNVFGFQAKTYKGLSGMKWMTSQKLGSDLRRIYANDKYWSSNYASLYSVYFLSKYVINIVNPVNIGIIYTGGFQFMSDFLEHIRFYMNVIAKSTQKNKQGQSVRSSEQRGGGFEIIPTVASNEIMMRTLSKGSQMMTANTIKHQDDTLTITLASVKHKT